MTDTDARFDTLLSAVARGNQRRRDEMTYHTVQSVKATELDHVARFNATNGGWRLHSWTPDPDHAGRLLVMWGRS